MLVQTSPADLQGNVCDGHHRQHIILARFLFPRSLEKGDDTATHGCERRCIEHVLKGWGGGVDDVESNGESNLRVRVRANSHNKSSEQHEQTRC